MDRLTAVNAAGFESPAGMTADPVVLAPRQGRLHVLLVPRLLPPDVGNWMLPGGFTNPDETPAETAQRKLTEKTGVGAVYLEQLALYGDPDRDPRGWIPSVAYLALIQAAVLEEGESAARWWPVDGLPRLAFDHGKIVGDATERLRGKLWYSNIAMGLLPEQFTMPAARRVYEAISGLCYEASNFRREMEQSGLVRPTGEVVKGVPGRPAQLYEWVSRTPSWGVRRSWQPAVAGMRADRAANV